MLLLLWVALLCLRVAPLLGVASLLRIPSLLLRIPSLLLGIGWLLTVALLLWVLMCRRSAIALVVASIACWLVCWRSILILAWNWASGLNRLRPRVLGWHVCSVGVGRKRVSLLGLWILLAIARLTLEEELNVS